MGRKQKQIYTATNDDTQRIKAWTKKEGIHGEENNRLMMAILDFYNDWIFKHNRQKDSIYHNSIYRILQAIGEHPQTHKEKQNHGKR